MHRPDCGPPQLIGPRRFVARSQLGRHSVLWNGNRVLDPNGPETRRLVERKSLVPKAGLEPARLAPHAPQTCVSAISPLRHMRLHRRRERHIIEVGQNPCQSIDGPVESDGSYSPGLPTLCRVTTSLLPRFLMMSLNDAHKGPSLHCSTSTTRSCQERPARYDSSGFCGSAAWWDGAS